MNVPFWYSSNATRSSSCVFITIGPYQATGSPSGRPERSRNRTGCCSVVIATWSSFPLVEHQALGAADAVRGGVPPAGAEHLAREGVAPLVEVAFALEDVREGGMPGLATASDFAPAGTVTSKYSGSLTMSCTGPRTPSTWPQMTLIRAPDFSAASGISLAFTSR